jgi:IS4 transposase
MTHQSLPNEDWHRAVERLGGKALLEKEAREFGAFERARKIKCALDQLRLIFAYCWGAQGLRLTVAWAEAMGLASLSSVALFKKMRNSADWLEHMVARLVGTRITDPVMSKGRPVRLVDTTSVAKAGRHDYENGGRWRVHSVFDLASERFTAFEVTDETDSEKLDRADVVAGEIRVGDRAYLQPARIAKVLDGGGDVVVRARWSGAQWLDGDGERIQLVPLLQKARRRGLVDQPIFIKRPGGDPMKLRLVAIRQPKPQRDLTIDKLKRRARNKCRKLRPQTLIAAEWLIIVTSLDRENYPSSAISDLYRLRWRIEIAFKHLKSGVGLRRPPAADPGSARAHILCQLLLALLTEPLIAEHLGDSPRREAA